MITSLAPCSFAVRGMLAAGSTTNDEPTREHDVGFPCQLKCILRHHRRQCLAERNRGMLQAVSVAGRAARDDIRPAKFVDQRVGVEPRVPVLALDRHCRAVQLQDAPAARSLVQLVDVLRDHAHQSPLLFPAGERLMAGVGPCVAELELAGRLLLPVFVPRVRRWP